jgi:hypothetical protein
MPKHRVAVRKGWKMTDKKSTSRRKDLLAEIGEILIQFQLSKQEKQKEVAGVETGNHDTTAAKSSSSTPDKRILQLE